MAATDVYYEGDGVTTDRNISWSYLDEGHNYVTVDGVDTSFTYLTATSIRISPAPASGTEIRIYRETPKTPLVTFSNPNVLTEDDLNTAWLQAVYLSEEAENNTLAYEGSSDPYLISSVEPGAAYGPEIDLWRNSPSPADADVCGQLTFSGENDIGQKWTIASINVTMNDVTDGTEDGALNLNVMAAGSIITPAWVNANGVEIANNYTLKVGTVNDSVTVQDDQIVVSKSVGGTATLADQSLTIAGVSATSVFASDQFRMGSSGAFGVAGTPQYSFVNDTDSGMYHAGTNVIGWSVAGLEYARLSAGALQVNSWGGDATVGPDLILKRASGSPAASDLIGRTLFRGKDSASNDHDYAAVRAQIQDPTNTSEDGILEFLTSQAGTLTKQLGITETGIVDLIKGQIKFPAAQNATSEANTLDDYEEGSWTPAFSFGGGTTGITYSAQSGFYTKIGRFVIATFDVIMTSKGTDTGAAKITGLPFALAGQGSLNVALYLGHTGLTGAYRGYVTSGPAVQLQQEGAAATANLTDAELTNSGRLLATITYQTT